jgi:hypothetical protein
MEPLFFLLVSVVEAHHGEEKKSPDQRQSGGTQVSTAGSHQERGKREIIKCICFSF